MIPDNARFFVADTETTGVGEQDRVCEVGWIEIDQDFNILGRVESLIDPERLIPAEASAIHGLTNKQVENSPTMDEFFSMSDPSCFGSKIVDPVVLIGHRIAFDHRFLKPYFTDVVQEICTLRWSRKLYPDSGNHQLSTMIYALNLPLSEGAHRVMADVLTSFHLCKHVAERTGLNLRQLAEASNDPMLMATMPFGKHKGSAIDDVPSSYLKWMQREMDLDIDLAFSIQTSLKNR